MKQLQGKRALITGAASGIGRAIALELAAEGMHLLLADKDCLGMQRTADDVTTHGLDVRTQYYDAACSESVIALARGAQRLRGGIDLLVNNAGVAYHGPTDAMSREHFDRLMAINLHSHLLLTQELLPTLLARREVHILNVCSILGLVGLPKVSAYNTAKFALVGYSESLRSEYGPQGVGVTALCPGLVRTRLFDSAISGDSTKRKQPPTWATTTPDRVAKVAVRSIKRNRGVVVVEPLARTLHLLRRFVPGLLEFALRLGSHRRVEKRVAYWQRQQNTTEAQPSSPLEGEHRSRAA